MSDDDLVPNGDSVPDDDTEGLPEELREAGLEWVAEVTGRPTPGGRVAARISDDGRRGAALALATETDSVDECPDFEANLGMLLDHVFEHLPADLETLLSQPWAGGGTVGDSLKALTYHLGEKVWVHQVCVFDNPGGQVGAYVHHDLKLAALASVTTSADRETAEGPLKDLCLHIVVFNPEALDRESIEVDLVEREKAIIREGLTGKPEEIQEKILAGRLEKFFAERVVTEQNWIKDVAVTVGEALARELGAGTELAGFSRLQVGG